MTGNLSSAVTSGVGAGLLSSLVAASEGGKSVTEKKARQKERQPTGSAAAATSQDNNVGTGEQMGENIGGANQAAGIEEGRNMFSNIVWSSTIEPQVHKGQNPSLEPAEVTPLDIQEVSTPNSVDTPTDEVIHVESQDNAPESNLEENRYVLPPRSTRGIPPKRYEPDSLF
ncbi:hypothetical protein GOBAR_DD08156 [Gossypium barbadense]|nr:hypothetical protein GOBAR_DD08156 [Gossypium barbadense]